MKKSGLIDMFGLSGDPISNGQLDGLLFGLESDTHLAHGGGAKNSLSPSIIVATASGCEFDDMLFNTSNEGERTIRLASYPSLQ
jgi:hypothetical protein